MAQPWIASEIEHLQYEDLTDLARVFKDDKGDKEPNYSGGYADVFIGELSLKGGKTNDVAIKVFRLGKESQENAKVKQYLIRETTVWQRLSHRNILPFIGLAEGLGRQGCPALISPMCRNGTITDYLPDHPEAERIEMMLGIVNGLEYLHEQNVIHGDLKPSNILISDDGLPVLCDFGRSRLITHRGFTTKPCGTVRYQAPELFEENATYSKPSDIYALGMTCSEICSGSKPYADFSNDATIILQVLIYKARPQCPDLIDVRFRPLWNILELCWRESAAERLDINEVKRRFTGAHAMSDRGEHPPQN